MPNGNMVVVNPPKIDALRETGETKPATVNWSSYGPVDVKFAERFLEQLTLAINEAKNMNAIYGVRDDNL